MRLWLALSPRKETTTLTGPFNYVSTPLNMESLQHPRSFEQPTRGHYRLA